jgi:ADP-L-glycero-D-manno-heptose 6-epimerase
VIIVTGAAGFIGSGVVAAFNSRGINELILVDHFDGGKAFEDPLNHDPKKENLKGKRFKDYLDKKDFLEAVVSDRIAPKAQCLIHMGACSSTTLQDEKYYKENNLEYTRSLAQWALKNNIRFIYASSAATYGDGRNGYKDDDDTIRRCKPLNYYGQSKQDFDLWALNQKVLDKMVGLKFFNVFGPNEYHKDDMRSVVAKAYDRVAKEGKMVLFKSYKKEYADGEQKRDFIYVKDAVDVVMFFYDHPQLNGIYNVGTGEARTWNDLAKALFKAVGKSVNIEYIEMPETIRKQYQYFTQADMHKLRGVGYQKPFTSLESAVGDYAKYLKSHTYL